MFKQIISSDYQFLKCIGKNANGPIYLARNKKNTTNVVIKIVPSFFVEKRISSVVNKFSEINHPALSTIQGIIDPERDSPTHYRFVSEFFENGSLSDVYKQFPFSSDSEFWNSTRKSIIAFGIAAAMQFLHYKNITHQFLTPYNILLDKFYQPHVSDYWFSSFLPKGCQQNSSFGQNAVYMAPECLEISNITDAADVFSYGIILYELAFEKPLYNNEQNTLADILKDVTSRPLRNTTFSNKLIDLIINCTQINPLKRPSFDYIIASFYDDIDPLFLNTNLPLFSNYRLSVIKNHVHEMSKISLFEFGNNPDNQRNRDSMLQFVQSSEYNIKPLFKYAQMMQCLNAIKFAADQGNKSAQFYYSERIAKVDKEESLKYLKKSADQNYMKAVVKMMNLDQEDDFYLKKAADLGNSSARIKYALKSQKLYYLRMAAKNHDSEALFLLAQREENGPPIKFIDSATYQNILASYEKKNPIIIPRNDDLFDGYEFENDDPQYPFKTSFFQDHDKAYNVISEISEKIIYKDLYSAINHYNQAVALNNSEAINRLDEIGKNGQKMVSKCTMIFTQNDQKKIDELIMYAVMLIRGCFNVERNVSQATQILTLAAKISSSPDAQYILYKLMKTDTSKFSKFGSVDNSDNHYNDDIENNENYNDDSSFNNNDNSNFGNSNLHNEIEALMYLKAAADQGHIKACFYYAQHLFMKSNSQGRPPILTPSLKYFRQAANLGCVKAILTYSNNVQYYNNYIINSTNGNTNQSFNYSYNYNYSFNSFRYVCPESIVYYRLAADRGSAISQYIYAKLLENKRIHIAHDAIRKVREAMIGPDLDFEEEWEEEEYKEMNNTNENNNDNQTENTNNDNINNITNNDIDINITNVDENNAISDEHNENNDNPIENSDNDNNDVDNNLCMNYFIHLRQKNMEDALFYLKLAAKQGLTEAMFAIAELYEKEKNLPFCHMKITDRDVTKKYLVAGSCGEPQAMYIAGQRFAQGIGVPADPDQALVYFRISAFLGNITAQYKYGHYLAFTQKSKKSQIERDANEGLRFLILAVSQGYNMNILMSLFTEFDYSGMNDQTNFNNIINMFKYNENFNENYFIDKLHTIDSIFSNNNNNTNDNNNKSTNMHNNNKEENNYDLKANYRMNNLVASYSACLFASQSIGLLYKIGIINEKPDLNEAMFWLEESANLGMGETFYYIGEIYEEWKEYEQAFQTFQYGHNEGIINCTSKLAHCYEKGLGIPKDIQTAAEYYESIGVDNVTNYFNAAQLYDKMYQQLSRDARRNRFKKRTEMKMNILRLINNVRAANEQKKKKNPYDTYLIDNFDFLAFENCDEEDEEDNELSISNSEKEILKRIYSLYSKAEISDDAISTAHYRMGQILISECLSNIRNKDKKLDENEIKINNEKMEFGLSLLQEAADKGNTNAMIELAEFIKSGTKTNKKNYDQSEEIPEDYENADIDSNNNNSTDKKEVDIFFCGNRLNHRINYINFNSDEQNVEFMHNLIIKASLRGNVEANVIYASSLINYYKNHISDKLWMKMIGKGFKIIKKILDAYNNKDKNRSNPLEDFYYNFLSSFDDNLLNNYSDKYSNFDEDKFRTLMDSVSKIYIILANLYEEGKCVISSPSRAISLCYSASELGHQSAIMKAHKVSRNESRSFIKEDLTIRDDNLIEFQKLFDEIIYDLNPETFLETFKKIEKLALSTNCWQIQFFVGTIYNGHEFIGRKVDQVLHFYRLAANTIINNNIQEDVIYKRSDLFLGLANVLIEKNMLQSSLFYLDKAVELGNYEAVRKKINLILDNYSSRSNFNNDISSYESSTFTPSIEDIDHFYGLMRNRLVSKAIKKTNKINNLDQLSSSLGFLENDDDNKNDIFMFKKKNFLFGKDVFLSSFGSSKSCIDELFESYTLREIIQSFYARNNIAYLLTNGLKVNHNANVALEYLREAADAEDAQPAKTSLSASNSRHLFYKYNYECHDDSSYFLNLDNHESRYDVEGYSQYQYARFLLNIAEEPPKKDPSNKDDKNKKSVDESARFIADHYLQLAASKGNIEAIRLLSSSKVDSNPTMSSHYGKLGSDLGDRLSMTRRACDLIFGSVLIGYRAVYISKPATNDKAEDNISNNNAANNNNNDNNNNENKDINNNNNNNNENKDINSNNNNNNQNKDINSNNNNNNDNSKNNENNVNNNDNDNNDNDKNDDNNNNNKNDNSKNNDNNNNKKKKKNYSETNNNRSFITNDISDNTNNNDNINTNNSDNDNDTNKDSDNKDKEESISITIGSNDNSHEVPISFVGKSFMRESRSLLEVVSRTSGRAAFVLGALFESGELLPKNYKKAFEYYSAAASLGFRESLLRMSAILAFGGFGLERDERRSLQYAQSAAFFRVPLAVEAQKEGKLDKLDDKFVDFIASVMEKSIPMLYVQNDDTKTMTVFIDNKQKEGENENKEEEKEKGSEKESEVEDDKKGFKLRRNECCVTMSALFKECFGVNGIIYGICEDDCEYDHEYEYEYEYEYE